MFQKKKKKKKSSNEKYNIINTSSCVITHNYGHYHHKYPSPRDHMTSYESATCWYLSLMDGHVQTRYCRLGRSHNWTDVTKHYLRIRALDKNLYVIDVISQSTRLSLKILIQQGSYPSKFIYKPQNSR